MAIDWDLVLGPHRRDPLARPAVAVAGLQAIAVEDAGNYVVLDEERQDTHGLDHISGRAVALSAPAPWQAVFGMGAAHPVDGEHDLRRRIIEIGNRLVDHGAHDPLPQSGIGRWGGPHRLQILGERLERHRRKRGLRRAGGVMLADPAFDAANAFKRQVPPRFEFTG
ncbi:hypothetical protein ACLF3G_27165 [Falsiroseomonas sp. HC035]|uniref:hypothetical protein n=1 Tax=Falsiroseomonas sp. HC035 TaxID=3390999 RepID=UPI003D31B7F6